MSKDLKEQIKNSKIVIKQVDSLIPYAKNSRKHSPSQIDKIAKSIQEFGFTNAVLIKPSGDIIAGHCRVLAAKKLKLKEVPCVELDLTDEQAKAYVIADNQLALISEWDEDLLSSELSYLSDSDFDLSILGFDDKFLSDIIEDYSEGKEGSSEEDDAYTKKIEAPIYTPKGEKPKVTELYDQTKTKELLEEIDKSEFPKDIKEFLKISAYRHTVFNYESIAEYYAHATAELQDLMEKSALVIIDFDKAIENGFVKMSKQISESYGDE